MEGVKMDKINTITLIWDQEKIEEVNRSLEGELIHLLWELEDNDCSIHGEEYCVSNYESGIDVYNHYDGLIYGIHYNQLKDLMKGLEITLHGRDPDEKE